MASCQTTNETFNIDGLQCRLHFTIVIVIAPTIVDRSIGISTYWGAPSLPMTFHVKDHTLSKLQLSARDPDNTTLICVMFYTFQLTIYSSLFASFNNILIQTITISYPSQPIKHHCHNLKRNQTTDSSPHTTTSHTWYVNELGMLWFWQVW